MPDPALQLRSPNQPDPLVDLTDAQRRQIGQRLALVQRWENMCRDYAAAGLTKADATKAFFLSHPEIRERTLYRWASRHREEGLLGLLDGRSTAVRAGVEPPSEDAWRYFLSLYLTIHRRTVALCHLMTAERAREQGWTWPSLRTIQLRVRDLRPVYVDYWRWGDREWWRRYRPKLRRDYQQYRAGEWWVGDFHELDVFCRRSDADPTIIRPLLSAFTDLRSRIVTGWFLTERENQDTVLLAFRRGVEQWGPPRFIVIDNGKPYRAYGVSGGRPRQAKKVPDEDYVRSVMGGLNVGAHFAIPYNPDSKPIERWFETLEIQFGATFLSYCGGQKDDRFREAHKLATEHPARCPTLDDLRAELGRYIEAYHTTPHTGDGMEGLPPARAFERFDAIPRAVLPEGSLDVLLMRVTKAVRVSEYGVRHNGIDYGQHDRRLFDLQGSKVLLRVDPDDASYVIVCDLDGKPICRARNNRLALSGVTQDDVRDGIRAQRRARKLVRGYFEGQATAARQDVSDAAIAARLKSGKRAMDALVAATGTDDVAPRNLTPLRSDFADAAARLKRQIDPPIAPPDQPTLEDVGELLGRIDPEADSDNKTLDIDQLYERL